MKKVIIMRGLPGSGKSTKAEGLLIDFTGFSDKTYGLYSTDDYFTHFGIYKFDVKQIADAHHWNYIRFKRAIKNKYNLIIIDNTNTQFWECEKYVEKALENKYMVQFVEPDTEWKFDVDTLVERNTHSVPKANIEKMLKRWQTTEQFLDHCEDNYECQIDPKTNEVFSK